MLIKEGGIFKHHRLTQISCKSVPKNSATGSNPNLRFRVAWIILLSLTITNYQVNLLTRDN
jgi:hypothetical protein